MTAIAGPGIPWPPHYSHNGSGALAFVSSNAPALAAASTRIAFCGRLYIDGLPTSAKTISAAGGGSVSFRTASVTWANGATNMDIGLQGVSTSGGPVAQPDGSFVVSRSCVPGVTAITTNAWNTITMGSGSANLTHGDPVSLVFDMTARGGTDTVTITGCTTQAACAMPSANSYVGGAWQTSSRTYGPNLVITFDDGTIGTIDGTSPFTTAAADTWADSNNPDERGIIFQVPFDCEVDQLWMMFRSASASADATLSLYSDPLGTPSSIASGTLYGEQGGTTGTVRMWQVALAAPVALTANTDYCVACRATNTGLVGSNLITLASAAHMALWPGGTNVRRGTRDGGSGAFTASSTTQYVMGVRLSSIGSSGGGNTYSRGRVVNAGAV